MTTSDDERLENHRAPNKAALPGGVQPFINPRLFTNRNFTVGLVLVFVYGMLNLTPTVLLPSMLQGLRGIRTR